MRLHRGYRAAAVLLQLNILTVELGDHRFTQ